MREAIPIELYSPARRDTVAAGLVRGLEKGDLFAIHDSWAPAKVAILQLCVTTNRTPPEHFHWNWRDKAGHLDFMAFEALGILCEDRWQGALLIDKARHRARLPGQQGKPIVYLDYMETAPWNLAEYVPEPPLFGVGTVFLAAAVEISIEEEWGGRIGLHSLPNAEPFYRRRGLVGLERDPEKQLLTYFEADHEIASAIRTGRKP